MRFRPLVVACSLLCLGLVSCDSEANARLVSSVDSPASEAMGQEAGSVQFRVELGPPGFLARSQEVRQYRIEKLVIGVYKANDTLPTVLDTVVVSTLEYFHYWRLLDVRFQWRVELQAIDSSGEVRYAGQELFQPNLNSPTYLTVVLHPKQNEMRLLLLGFDGLSKVEVSVGYQEKFVWEFDSAIRAGDTMILSKEFQYFFRSHSLPSSSIKVSVSVYGNYFGAQTKVFQCDTNLRIRYGQDSIVRLRLRWVGTNDLIDTLQQAVIDARMPDEPFYFGLEYPAGFSPAGDTGNFVDLRDGKMYGFKRFGTLVWMTENLRYGCDTCGISGARYSSPDYVAMACPIGWRVPQEKDWKNLIEHAALGGGTMMGLIHLMTPDWFSGERYCGYEDPSNYPEDAELVWSCGMDMGGEPVGGDDSSGFHLVPTGLLDWSGGHLSTSYEYGRMWSRWAGGMSSIHIDNRAYHFYPVNEWMGSDAPGLRCVTD